MPMSATEIRNRILAALPDAEVELTALVDDNDHWQAHIRSAAFAGKTRVAQHQMVYAAFGADMGTTLHAMSITTEALAAK